MIDDKIGSRARLKTIRPSSSSARLVEADVEPLMDRMADRQPRSDQDNV